MKASVGQDAQLSEVLGKKCSGWEIPWNSTDENPLLFMFLGGFLTRFPVSFEIYGVISHFHHVLWNEFSVNFDTVQWRLSVTINVYLVCLLDLFILCVSSPVSLELPAGSSWNESLKACVQHKQQQLFQNAPTRNKKKLWLFFFLHFQLTWNIKSKILLTFKTL